MRGWRRRHRRIEPTRLNLTAMVDVFTVLLVFLLKSYSAEGNIITTTKNLELPLSTSTIRPLVSVTITVTEEAIFVEDERIEEVKNLEAMKGLFITTLAEALSRQVRKAREIAEANPAVSFEGRITILGDKKLPFFLLEKIMYTAARAEFGDIALAVFQKER